MKPNNKEGKAVNISHLNGVIKREILKRRIFSDFYFFAKDFMDIHSPETGERVIYKDPHREVCDYLTTMNKDLIICLPREFGKTCLIELYAIWYIMKYPERTIFIFSENATKAEDIIGTIRMMMESNHNFVEMFGKNLFSKKRNTLNEICLSSRTTTDKEPNIEAHGIGDSTQGFRCDLIVFEDIVGPNYISSPKTKKNVDRFIFNESTPLIKKVHHSRRIMTCTRWAYNDPVGQIKEDGRKASRWDIIEKSAEDEYGNSAYPHIISNEKLFSKRDDMNSFAFYACQYLNKPKSEESSVFDVQVYLKKFGYIEPSYIRKKVMAIDLAYSTASGGDDRALVILGIDDKGIMYLLDAFATNIMTYSIFYSKIKEFYDKYLPYKVLIEINNAEPIFDSYRAKSNENKDYIPFVPIIHKENKISRIESLEYGFSNGALVLPVKYKDNAHIKKLIDYEMEYFNRTIKDNKDDLLDALETAYSDLKKQKRILNSEIECVDNREYKDAIW